MAGNIKPTEAGSQPCRVRGQAGQLSDECSCGHVDLLLRALDVLPVSADVTLCGGIKTFAASQQVGVKLHTRNRCRTPQILHVHQFQQQWSRTSM